MKTEQTAASGSAQTAEQQQTACQTFVHVPTPGDHYSPATGSAMMAVVYELSRKHDDHGGHTRIIVGHGTRHDYPIGECTEVVYTSRLSARRKLVDAGLGRLGLPRPLEAQLYGPARLAIERDFDGPVFLHNSPGALHSFRGSHRKAQLCLYAVNSLFRTYARPEARRTVGYADCVICCSEFIADELAGKLGHRANNIKVVLNGVDIERFRPVSPVSVAAAEDEPIILFIGRAVPDKGPDLLLKAAQKIYSNKGRKQRRFKVRIVGSRGFAASTNLSPFEKELRKIAEPIQEIVEFQPSVDRIQLLREYQAAAIFCAPSNWDDPCPLTVLEAMACGVPTVASSRGGIPEEGGQDIFYFKPPDVDELAEHLAFLIDDEGARREWGRRARARAELFSWETQYLKLREALVN